MDKIKIYFLFTFIWVYSLPVLAYSAISPTTTKDVDVWAVTATAFKLVGEKEVRNVKLNWMQRKDTDLYKIYRDGNLIGETKGGTFDDYSLPVGKSFTYYIEAFNNGQKIATAASRESYNIHADS